MKREGIPSFLCPKKRLVQDATNLHIKKISFLSYE